MMYGYSNVALLSFQTNERYMFSRYENAREPKDAVLLVGFDDPERDAFAAAFESDGFDTLDAEDGSAADDVIASDSVDLVVLDDRMSRGGVITFCKKSSTQGGAPIILLAGTADETDRIVALELGADKLLSKPISPRLLVAEARALLRRRHSSRLSDRPAPAPDRNWQIDIITRDAISPAGRRVALTPIQTSLFGLFLDNPGVVFTMEQIAARVCGDDATPESFRTLVSRLRRRLEQGGDPAAIRNIRGSGYVFG